MVKKIRVSPQLKGKMLIRRVGRRCICLRQAIDVFIAFFPKIGRCSKETTFPPTRKVRTYKGLIYGVEKYLCHSNNCTLYQKKIVEMVRFFQKRKKGKKCIYTKTALICELLRIFSLNDEMGKRARTFTIITFVMGSLNHLI